MAGVEKVTRVEIITDSGRKASFGSLLKVELALQDDGRTLKLFLKEGVKPTQSLSSVPLEKLCPMCDKPEDYANDPENPFIQTGQFERMHLKCARKAGKVPWSR